MMGLRKNHAVPKAAGMLIERRSRMDRRMEESFNAKMGEGKWSFRGADPGIADNAHEDDRKASESHGSRPVNAKQECFQ